MSLIPRLFSDLSYPIPHRAASLLIPATIMVLTLLPIAVRAQTATARLFVTVTDGSGASISGVEIHLQNQATGSERSGTTAETGILVVPSLVPGGYVLRASATGFRTETIRNLQLQVGVTSAIDIAMTPGSPSDSIEVSADLSTLRPVTGTLEEVLDNRTIMSMPLNGREFLELALLSTGAAPPAQGSELSTQASSGINVNGARESANNFLLDGVDNNDLFTNRLVINPGLDAIQEFTIFSNGYDAEYGRNAGAQVNVVLKSGGRDLHGSVYEYFRHSGMDARNFFDEETPFLRQNQFGGTLGGPLGASQNFFFTNLEGRKSRRAQTRSSVVPTLLEKDGDFGTTGSTIVDPFSGEPFGQNRIPEERIDGVGAAVAGLYPDPNNDSPNRNFLASPTGTTDLARFTVRTDHELSERTAFLFRYGFNNDSRDLPYSTGGPNFPGFGTTVLDRGQNFAFGLTRILSPLTINEFRFGYNRLRREVFTENSNLNGFDALGMSGPSLEGPEQGFSTFVVAGYEGLGDDPNLPTIRRTGNLHFSDVLNIQKGSHHFKIGGEVRHYRQDGIQRLFARGQLIFTGAFTGDALADLLLGFPSLSILGTSNNTQALRTWAYNGFLADDWTISSNLTLNLGLRYEFNGPPVDSQDRLTVFDPATATLLPVGQGGVPRAGIDSDLNNFAPRLGLAWDLFGSGKVVMRAGYGVFYDSGTVVENSALYFNPPNFRLDLFFPGADPLLVGNPFPDNGGFEPPPSPFTLDRDFRSAYAQHWSLGLSGQVGRDLVLEARYVGSKGSKLVSKRNLNQPPPAPGMVDFRRPIPGFGDILFVEPGGASTYNSLQLRAQRRFSNRLSFLAAYTYSKSIDNASSFLGTDGYNNTPQDSSNIAAEKALSNFDLRNRLSLALVYAFPSAQHFLLDNWQLSSILVVQSGRPLTPRLEFDNSNTGNVGGVFGSDRPDLVGNPELADSGPDQFFNPDAFRIPEPFQFGNSGRNTVVGPGLASLDLSLSKSFAMAEDGRIEFRAEVFNALNRSNLELPDGFIGRPTFGKILSALPAREIQLVLRWSF